MPKYPKIPSVSPDAFLGFKEMPLWADPQGSYTGVPEEPYQVPVQDADDL